MTKLVRCGINFYADVDNKKAVNDRDALQNTKLMEHYTHLLGQLQYEGAGIWVSIRPRACFFPLFSFLPLWLHYNLNPLCVQY